MLHLQLKRHYENQEKLLERIQTHEHTIELLQEEDIQDFLIYAKEVLAGNISIDKDEENWFSLYSYNTYMKERFPVPHTIESDLMIREVQQEDDRYKLVINDYIRYSDEFDKTLYSTGHLNDITTLWIIEKQNTEWILVEVDERYGKNVSNH